MGDNYYIKYDGSTVENAVNIKYSQLLSAKDKFSFTLPNNYSRVFSTWDGRIEDDVELWDSTGTDYMVCKGVIDTVSDTDPITIGCLGEIDKLSWKIVNEESAKMNLDVVKVSGTPPSSADDYVHGVPTASSEYGNWTNDGGTIDESYGDRYNVLKLNTITKKISRDGLADAAGTIEFWFRVGVKILNHWSVKFEDDADNVIGSFEFNAGNPIKANGNNWYIGCNVNEWYRVKIVWSEIGNAVEFTIWDEDANQLDLDQYAMLVGAAAVDEIIFRNDALIPVGLSGIGYTEDDDYTLGDNLTPVKPVINCVTEEDDAPDPGWSDAQWKYDAGVQRWGIISDATRGTNTETLQSENTSTATNTLLITGTHADTQSEDGSFWKCLMDDSSQHMTIRTDLLIQNDNIPVTNKITKISYSISIKMEYADIANYENMAVDIYWSKDNSLSTSTDYLIGTITLQDLGAGKYQTFLRDENAHWITVSDEDNTAETYLAKIGGEWSGGYIFIYQRSVTDVDEAGVGLVVSVDYINVVIEHESSTFDEINEKILGTMSGTGYDMIVLNDPDNAGRPLDLTSAGINTSDEVVIGISMENALSRCFLVPLEHIFNIDGTEFTYGVGDDLGPQNALQMFKTLCDGNNLLWFSTYEDNDYTLIHVCDEDDIAAATVTYSSALDMPSKFNSQSKSNEYGAVVIQYKNGLTPRILADTPSSSKRDKLILKKDILTRAKAMAYGKKMANKHASKQRSIQLDWNYHPTNMPVVGTKYDITVPLDDGTDLTDTLAYTDQICRMVEVQQDGTSGGKWAIHAEFGTSSTSGVEAIGKDIAFLYNELAKDHSLSLTGEYSSLKRHAQLTGVLSTQHDIPASIAAGIATHKALPNDHHTPTVKYTDAEAQTQAQAVSINNVVEDTTPQLGGNLDANSKAITSLSSLDFVAAGSQTVDKIQYYQVDPPNNGFSNVNDELMTAMLINDYIQTRHDAINTYYTGYTIAPCNIHANNGSSDTGSVITADEGQGIKFWFYLDSNVVDTSSDIYITMTFSGDGEATHEFDMWAQSIKTDTSEVSAWNASNPDPTPLTADGTPADRNSKLQFTIAAALIADDDEFHAIVRNSHAGTTILIHGVYIRYKKAEQA